MNSRPANVKNPNVILLNPGVELEMLGNTLREGIEIYKSANKRLIMDSEVGLAAVYNSIDKHCNPFFKGNSERNILAQKLGSQTQPRVGGASASVSSSEGIPESQLSRSSRSNSASLRNTVVKDEPCIDIDDDDVMISDIVPASSHFNQTARRNEVSTQSTTTRNGSTTKKR